MDPIKLRQTLFDLTRKLHEEGAPPETVDPNQEAGLATDGAPVPDTEMDGMDDMPMDDKSAQDQTEEEPQDDEYAGPQADHVVGDSRNLHVFALSGDYTEAGGLSVGEAWQDENGDLHGTGILAVMLFEPLAQSNYRSSSLGHDLSPLTMLYKRLARNTLFRTEMVDGDNDGQ